ncbi:MAG: glutamate--tRNA ligase [Sphingomonadaceae bacterium]|nr:glutamate--tRNA ligase [Sphingomonadaceae bacterium]
MASNGVNNGQALDRPVVTRFAPSPTGFLHIGGARTALFSWLFARHHGGKALLRIEDTDRARSTQQAIDAILSGLEWLGLEWDEDPVFQSERGARHVEVAEALLANGHAYRCYATQAELEEMRSAQRAAKQPLRYDGRWRDRDPSHAPAGAPFVVRVKTSNEGETVIDDAVQGTVRVNNAEIDDYIILRSDGSPTYMLAAVVDDHDMGCTHIVRGDDHLNNAFRQLPIITAMNEIEGNWAVPVYAHIPLIHGADGAKLSKRHGALGIETYRDEMGIVPEALFNYLLRLGWGYGDEEVISRDKAIELFELSGIGQSPSRFDLAKLQNLNGIYLRDADDARLTELVSARMDGKPDTALLARAMPVLKVRAKDINELADAAAFLFAQRPLTLTEKAEKQLDNDARGRLAAVHEHLETETVWTIESLEASLKEKAEQLGLGFGKLAQPLRAALTGQTTSPGIFDVLVLLGRDESLARIAAQATVSAGS